MRVLKQKWTQEEESALKAGVIKHGPGKWRTVLRDPEFSGVLYLRSNVDLKDKWRNMSAVANGWGSRYRSRLAVKRTQSLPKQEDNSLEVSTTPAPSRLNLRLDYLIMEAIATLKEPSGSNKTSIRAYIEEHYNAPVDFKRLLSTKLKDLTACSKLLKVKNKYRIPNTPLSAHKKRNMGKSSGKQSILSSPSPRTDRDEVNIQTRSQIDIELARMKSMNIHEAELVAGQAVAEAEAAMAEAEEAAKEAEEAEAKAETALAFAKEAAKKLKGRETNEKKL